MNRRTVGVIGAGVMGVGVSQNLAQTQHHVVLVDVSEDILQRARAELMKSLRFAGLFDKKSRAEHSGEVLERITFTTDYGLLHDVEFVIENATEKWDIKKDVYARLDAVCRQSCIVGANTSAIPITRLASITRRAPQVIGMHFMNPVPLKPFVEVVRGHYTSEQTVAAATALLAEMGKECIVVNDAPGFVSNRIMMLTINEAIFLLQEQVATAEEVDTIFKKSFGHQMGPLETADLIGLDTILFSIEVLYESFSDSKYRPCALLRKMVDAKLLGRKSGQGFYNYQV